jgi:hypothetical protein
VQRYIIVGWGPYPRLLKGMAAAYSSMGMLRIESLSATLRQNYIKKGPFNSRG